MQKLENLITLKEKSKCENGITLVALVITIVIIIILAAITISAALGDKGLIWQAKYAKDLTTNSTEKEQEDREDFAAELNEIAGDFNRAKTLVQAFKDGDLEVGDYVNYTPEAHSSVTVGTDETGYTNSYDVSDGTDQTFTQDPNTTWRVLGLSEDENNLLLISGSPIKKDGSDPYLELESSAGAANNVTILNKICGIYHNSELAENTRSITIEDIERVLGGVTVEYQTVEGDGGKVYLNKDASKTDISISGLISLPSYTYKDGDYTLTHPPIKATAGNKIDADAYNFTYDYDQYESLGIDISQRVFDMLFADTLYTENSAKAYWLAASGVAANEYGATFGPGAVGINSVASEYGLYATDGAWIAYGFAVRPVVVLKSSIEYGEGAGQLKNIEDQEEETWTTQGGQICGAGM